jgi:acetolactate synthase-1/2/3 large subunit
MPGHTRTGADAIVQGLVLAGVQHVFGLPGDTGVDLYDSLARAGSALRHVMCRDERHAAVMADVYARCTRRVGVVEVSSGGGVTFCVGGLGEPFAASVPVLVIASDIHAKSRNTGALTELDQERLFAAVTKWARRVEHADEIPGLLTEAIVAAVTGRPAPVVLIVPENVLLETTAVPYGVIDARLPTQPQVPDLSLIEAVAKRLRRAERPAIVAGGGVHSSGAYQELAELAECAGVPVATTIHGKGTYVESAPWSLGVVGANGGRPYVNEYLTTADFVLFVGTRANATDTNSFTSPPRTTEVAQIDIDPERAGRNYPGSIGIVADAGAALAELAAVLGPATGQRPVLRERLETWRAEWRRLPIPVPPDGMVHPLQVFREVRERFGADAIVVADCGTATPFLAAHWESECVGRRLLVARGHGPMGYAIPGAIGAAIAHAGRPIVSVTTDGSLAMACGELETAARLQLPITYIQLSNGSFGWIKMLQHLYHDRRYFGVDLGRVDAPAIARGFGILGVRVNGIQDLREALRNIGEPAAGPFFIEVVVPELIAAPPPVAPWTATIAGIEAARPVY